MPGDLLSELPQPAKDGVTNSDIYMLLVHPLYGIGAINAAVQQLDSRMGNIVLTQEEAKAELAETRTEVKELANRIPFTEAQAEVERKHLMHRESRHIAWRTSFSTMKNKAVEHIGIVLGATVAALLVGGNLWHHVSTTLERLFHLEPMEW